MKRRVIAVGLDSGDFDLLQRYMDAGQMPHLRRLRGQSALVRLETQASYADGSAPYASTEGNWVMFQTGVHPSTSGYWETVGFDPQTYRATNDFVHGGYDYREFAPFYALGQDYRVATFDVPVSAVVPNVNGVQVVGWGGHFPYVVRGSQPPELLAQLNAGYGRNRMLYRDHGVFYRRRYLEWVEKTAIECIQQRGRICHDLLQREPWDLFLTVLGETHSALHELWAGSDPRHPVHETCRISSSDRLLNVFKTVDQTVGSLAEQAGNRVNFVLFSVHGMHANATDLPCLFFLSELMYRLNFPGKAAIAAGDPTEPPPPPVTSGIHHDWFGEIWRRRHVSNKLLRAFLQAHPAWLLWMIAGRDLRFPYFMNPMGAENGWMPTLWYRPSWPRMRSFAIPAFADGHIRINLTGREARGIVPPGEYDQECDRITRLLLRVQNSRTGEPVVRKVFRTRRSPRDSDPRLPPADLVVQWEDRVPFDLIESPEIGRIGPVPYFRTGGHRAGGFAMLRGPGIPEGSTLARADVFDLPVTLLHMLGAPVPPHLPGKPLLDLSEASSPPLAFSRQA